MSAAPWPRPKGYSTQAYQIDPGDVVYRDTYCRVISRQIVGGEAVKPLYQYCARPMEGTDRTLEVWQIRADERMNKIVWYRELRDSGTHEVLHLVSCVSKKRPEPSRAESLYTSPWFVAARRHVCREPWGILSARHGFVRPEQMIEPYDDKLTRARSGEWTTTVLPTIPAAHRYVIWAGAIYTEHLAPALNAEVPLRGMGIGEQLGWFRSQRDRF